MYYIAKCYTLLKKSQNNGDEKMEVEKVETGFLMETLRASILKKRRFI